MCGTYMDNAPEEDGAQLHLNMSLSVAEQNLVQALGGEYDEDYHDEVFQFAWINCDDDQKQPIIELLKTFGLTEQGLK